MVLARYRNKVEIYTKLCFNKQGKINLVFTKVEIKESQRTTLNFSKKINSSNLIKSKSQNSLLKTPRLKKNYSIKLILN